MQRSAWYGWGTCSVLSVLLQYVCKTVSGDQHVLCTLCESELQSTVRMQWAV